METVDPLAELRAVCDAAGSQRAWAAAHGLSVSYLSDVLLRRRPPGPAILRALGLRRIETYTRQTAADALANKEPTHE